MDKEELVDDIRLAEAHVWRIYKAPRHVRRLALNTRAGLKGREPLEHLLSLHQQHEDLFGEHYQREMPAGYTYKAIDHKNLPKLPRGYVEFWDLLKLNRPK